MLGIEFDDVESVDALLGSVESVVGMFTMMDDGLPVWEVTLQVRRAR